ncbi:hypothetical protein Tco_0238672, partial [Tanacetum coccineum]
TAEDEDPVAEDEGLTAEIEGPGMDDEGYGLDDECNGRDDESRGIDEEGYSVESDELGLGYGVLRRRELALEEGDVYSTFEVGQGSGSTPESERPERVSAFRHPTLTTLTDSEDATPAAVETEGFLSELGAQVQMQGGLISDHVLAEERRARLELAEVVDGIRRRQEPRGGTDKSKIKRKQSKAGKHGHEYQKSSKRSQRFKAKASDLKGIGSKQRLEESKAELK